MQISLHDLNTYNRLFTDLVNKGSEHCEYIRAYLNKHLSYFKEVTISEDKVSFAIVGQVFNLKLKLLPEKLVRNREACLITTYFDMDSDSEVEIEELTGFYDKIGNISGKVTNGSGVDIHYFMEAYSKTIPRVWHDLNISLTPSIVTNTKES